jgi:hypothetical protein
MAIYLGFTMIKDDPVMTGSLDDVLAWGSDMLTTNQVVKIARARSERASVKIVADMTSEGVCFVRTPRVLPFYKANKLCQRARAIK